MSPEVDPLKEHDRPVQVDVNAASGVLGVGDTKLVLVLIDVVSSVTVSVTVEKDDAAYTWVTVGLAPVTTELPSPKFQLYVVMVPPVSVEPDASNAHDKPVRFEVKAATGFPVPRFGDTV